MSQEELAHAAGLDRGYIGMIENAKYSASVDTLQKIAKAFDVDPHVFLLPRDDIEPS